MKKDLGVLEAVFPMPILMIGTYNEDGTVNVMTAAWGQVCDYKQIALFLDEGHKTAENILKTKAFTWRWRIRRIWLEQISSALFPAIRCRTSLPVLDILRSRAVVSTRPLLKSSHW